MVHIPEKIDSKYRFVLLASKRAEQIVEGAAPKEEAPPSKATRLGMSEISDSLIEWGYGPAEVPEEVEAEPAEVAES